MAAVHHAGLVTIASTPWDCDAALRELLNRPANEKLCLLLPLGYPAKDATVTSFYRKQLEEIMIRFD